MMVGWDIGRIDQLNTIMRRVGPSPSQLWEHFIAFIAITECSENARVSNQR